MIDTHCHLTFPGLYDRIDDVIAHAANHGVDRMISIGTTLDDAPQLAGLADRNAAVTFTVGLHPHEAAKWANRLDDLKLRVQRWAQHPRCVAVGEIGLDRHYPDPPIEAQRDCLQAQLELLRGDDAIPLPVVIHNREATDETLAVLRESGVPGDRFVFHCFTGTPGRDPGEELESILDFGATIGFTGIVTFKNAADLAAASDRVPLDRLLIETDSPYLAPEPYRKVRPNEPRYVAEVAAFLAARRGLSVEAFTQAVDGNARRLFAVD